MKATAPPNTSPRKQLLTFMTRYSPEVAAVARAAIATLSVRLPGAVQLIYDNYNALVIGFGPTERASDALFSVVLYPRWVTFFFLDGATLDDRHGVLKGSGRRVRHIVLEDAAVLDRPPVKSLIRQALADAVGPPIDRHRRGRIVIKSVSASQRPRRPRPAMRKRAKR